MGFSQNGFVYRKNSQLGMSPLKSQTNALKIFLLLARKHYGQPVICVPKLKPLTAINELKIIIFVLNDLSVLVYILKKKIIVMCLNNIFHPSNNKI